MANETQEFFLGQNEQEIENEKRRKKILMHYLPHLMGDTDKTTYILRKDDNTYRNESFGSDAIDKPGTVVISNGGEKSQEQNREQMPKASDFGNRNFETPFASSGFTQAGYLSGFNNTKRDGVFDTTDRHDKVHKTTPRPEANRGLEPDSINKSDHSDLLWSDRKPKRTYYNPEPGIYGILPKRNYTKQIHELKSQLPQRMLRILNELGTEIRVLDNLHYVDKDGNIRQPLGTYYSNKITLDSKHVNIETLLAETIHAVQDYLGMTENELSNLEFQEHVLKDLYFNQLSRKIYGDYSIDKYSLPSSARYIELISNIFDENNNLNLNNFINNIDYLFEDFQEHFSQSKSYQTPKTNNFNYNWISFFDILGIQYK